MMANLSIAATAALVVAVTAPAVAQDAKVDADPFISSAEKKTALAVLGGTTFLLLIAATGKKKNNATTGSK